MGDIRRDERERVLGARDAADAVPMSAAETADSREHDLQRRERQATRRTADADQRQRWVDDREHDVGVREVDADVRQVDADQREVDAETLMMRLGALALASPRTRRSSSEQAQRGELLERDRLVQN
ncbi:MAG TPA: hypothetical protein VGB74_20300 [Actinoplanes sp.]